MAGYNYIPPDFVVGRHVFFAIDNVDFAEDTPNGKGTLHATAMAIYQRKAEGDHHDKLRLDEPSVKRSLTAIPTVLLD